MSDSTIDDSRAIEDRVPESTRLDARYEQGALLGEGGMGEVRECRDRVLDRKVGLKLVRRDRLSRDLETRFVREACVQAQLEHPGVVPVYEVGRAESGAAFFTMRRVSGLTLDDIIEKKRKSDPDIEAKFTRHRLLTAFAQVCLTVDYAHSRGVLHRDIKPSNVMFGDFGEVYVLDWGLAKLTAMRERNVDQVDLDMTGPTAPGARRRKSVETAIGATLGTPAYMSPEQMGGANLDARADVFALGCLLFEILTLEPLFDEETVAARLKFRKTPWDARPSLRAPGRNVPPEFDRICVRATADAIDKRYPSARALHDAIESWLEGERDLELRKEKAKDLLDRAEANRASDPDGALHDVNRALALAPGEPRGLVLLVNLLEETPGALERARTEAVSESIARLRRQQPLGALLFTLPWLTLYPALLVVHRMSNAWLALAPMISWIATGVAMLVDHRMKTQETVRYPTWLTGLALACSATVFGPLYVVPALAVAVIANHVLVAARGLRGFTIALGCVAVAMPIALAWAGVHDLHHFVDGDTFELRPVFRDMRAERIGLVITAINAVLVVGSSLFTSQVRDEIERSRKESVLVAWHLARLLPAEIGTPAAIFRAHESWGESSIARILDTAIDDVAPRADRTVVQPSTRRPDDDQAPESTRRDPLLLEGPRYEPISDDVFRDQLIGRDVLMKPVRTLDDAILRARVDHPGAPPIYDVVEDERGLRVSTKPVSGIRIDESARADLGRHRLLAAFAQVCLTLDFAHARGVVHGGLDAKRVVLGDFGEVYVVGWGERDGYAAPEQAGGAEPDTRADVFALGAVLFEILAGEPLVPGDRREIVLGRYDARPSARASARGGSEIAPELDDICVRATAYEPGERFPSARALHEAIESFLGSDRDIALRRKLAADHLARAEKHEKENEREAALRELGRALALAPERDAAVALLGRFLASPPSPPPADVAREIEEQRLDATLRPARVTALGYAFVWIVVFPAFALVVGIRDWSAIVFVMLSWALATMGLFLQRRSSTASLLGFLGVVSTAFLFGPYLVVPAACVAMAMGHILGGPLRHRAIVIAIALLTLIVPVVLESAGITHLGGFVSDPNANGVVLATVRGAVTPGRNGLHLALAFASLATMLIGTLHAARYRDVLEEMDATNRARIHALSRLVTPTQPK